MERQLPIPRRNDRVESLANLVEGGRVAQVGSAFQRTRSAHAHPESQEVLEKMGLLAALEALVNKPTARKLSLRD
jgi:NAD(P)H-dependent flavin oxidoreductase YrpB (nitropropane dioxygenase family)